MNYRCLLVWGGGIYGSLILGWNTLAYVEREPYCQKVIKQRIEDGWFHAGEIYGSIEEFNKNDAHKYTGKVDVLTGGFPCQPFSVAGKGKGRSDERYLFDEIIKTIEIVQPRRLLFENVPGILAHDAIIKIYESLIKIGYRPKAPLVLGSADCGNIHKRERVWIFADSEEFRSGRWQSEECDNEWSIGKQIEQERREIWSQTSGCAVREIHATNDSGERCNHGKDYREKRQVQETTIRELEEIQPERSQHVVRTNSKPNANVANTKQFRRAQVLCNQETTSNKQKKQGSAIEFDSQVSTTSRRSEKYKSIQDIVDDISVPEPLLCRVDNEFPHIIEQLKAIGNGQDPIVMATAWNILSNDYL